MECFKYFKRYTKKRPLRRSRHTYEDNIRMNIKKIGINARNWVDSGQDRDYWRVLVNATLNEHPGSISHGVRV